MSFMKSKKKSQDMENDDDMPTSKGTPSLAIAFNVQKAARKKKMAKGGMINTTESQSSAEGTTEPATPAPTSNYPAIMKENYDAEKWAMGGEVHPSDLMSDDERATSIADAIRNKRKKMAEGGGVSDNAEESGQTPFAEDNGEAFENGEYDPNQLDSDPEDSNLTGDSEESDSENDDDTSILGKIKKSLRSKRG